MSDRGDAGRNAREIASAGRSTLLECIVRRIAIASVTALIDANNDDLWGGGGGEKTEDYDRRLKTDVFAIQTYLAQKIASALPAKRSPNGKSTSRSAPPKILTPIGSSSGTRYASRRHASVTRF